MSNIDNMKDANGKYVPYAWPGGYPVMYLTRDGMCICADCANKEVDQSQAVTDAFIHWEGAAMQCEDCEKFIESAYGEEE